MKICFDAHTIVYVYYSYIYYTNRTSCNFIIFCENTHVYLFQFFQKPTESFQPALYNYASEYSNIYYLQIAKIGVIVSSSLNFEGFFSFTKLFLIIIMCNYFFCTKCTKKIVTHDYVVVNLIHLLSGLFLLVQCLIDLIFFKNTKPIKNIVNRYGLWRARSNSHEFKNKKLFFVFVYNFVFLNKIVYFLRINVLILKKYTILFKNTKLYTIRICIQFYLKIQNYFLFWKLLFKRSSYIGFYKNKI